MKLIKAVGRPIQVADVKDTLTKNSIFEMPVTEVRGYDRQQSHSAVYRESDTGSSCFQRWKSRS